MATDWKTLLSTFDTKNPVRTRNAPVQKPSYAPEPSYAHASSGAVQAGVLFTDTRILAGKFAVSQQEVQETLMTFLSEEEVMGRKWLLLDASLSFPEGPGYRNSNWESYSYCLNDFFRRNQIRADEHTPVFIIGGDDVIPIPLQKFPIAEETLGFVVEFDLYYCFKPGTQITVLLNRLKDFGEQGFPLVMEEVQCNIGRLPIEKGPVSSSFQDVVGEYLRRIEDTNAIIPAGNILSLSARDWLDGTAYVINGIPRVMPGMVVPFVTKGIFSAPPFCCEKPEMSRFYLEVSQHADIAFFNLHGGKEQNNSAYAGDPEKPIAFTPSMAEEMDTPMVCSLACYGARHTDYAPSQSIMLTFLQGQTLLFIGSCQPSFARDNVRGFGEVLFKAFFRNLYRGLPAGEAFLRAKLWYLLHFWPMDDFSCAYLTIGEFNLFGNPLLMATDENIHIDTIEQDLGNTPIIQLDRKDIQTFADTSLPHLDDAYIEVREAVDSAWLDIEKRLSNLLYRQHAMENLHLVKMYRSGCQTRTNGFKFVYTFNSLNDGIAIAKTDKDGNLVDLVRTR